MARQIWGTLQLVQADSFAFVNTACNDLILRTIKPYQTVHISPNFVADDAAVATLPSILQVSSVGIDVSGAYAWRGHPLVSDQGFLNADRIEPGSITGTHLSSDLHIPGRLTLHGAVQPVIDSFVDIASADNRLRTVYARTSTTDFIQSTTLSNSGDASFARVRTGAIACPGRIDVVTLAASNASVVGTLDAPCIRSSAISNAGQIETPSLVCTVASAREAIVAPLVRSSTLSNAGNLATASLTAQTIRASTTSNAGNIETVSLSCDALTVRASLDAQTIRASTTSNAGNIETVSLSCDALTVRDALTCSNATALESVTAPLISCATAAAHESMTAPLILTSTISNAGSIDTGTLMARSWLDAPSIRSVTISNAGHIETTTLACSSRIALGSEPSAWVVDGAGPAPDPPDDVVVDRPLERLQELTGYVDAGIAPRDVFRALSNGILEDGTIAYARVLGLLVEAVKAIDLRTSGPSP